MRNILHIFFTFFRISSLTFGGGYAMLPMLHKETVDKYGWLSEGELADYYTLAQCEPGLIAVNVAVLIARPRFGFWGAVAAVTGVVLPSFLVISLLALSLERIAHLPAFAHAFAGIRVAVAALVIQSLIRLVKTGVTDWITTMIALAALALLFLGLVNSLMVILVAALVALAIGWFRLRSTGRKE